MAHFTGAGVFVNALAFRWGLRRGRPLLAPRYVLPRTRTVDLRLVAGAATFGVGWGLGGFCPGPAVVSAAGGAPAILVFVLAMLGSMAAFDAAAARRLRPHAPKGLGEAEV